MNREEVLNIKKGYEDVYEVLESVDFLLGKDSKTKDICEMNDWLRKVVSFYNKLGIEVNVDDFMTEDNEEVNKIVRTYMEVFLNNQDKEDENVFLTSIFDTLKDDVYVSDNVKEVPILNEIKMGVMALHLKNKEVFVKLFEMLNKRIENMGYERVTFDNLDEVKKDVKKNIDLYNGRLFDILIDETDKKVKDADTDRICNIITMNRYMNMDESEKENLLKDLPKIADIIVKYRVFTKLDNDYTEYSIDNKYFVLRDLFRRKENVKNRLLTRLSNKKISEKRSLRITKKINQCDQYMDTLISKYFRGFYNKYNLDKNRKEYNLLDISDDKRLFGVFEFDKIPLSELDINDMEVFKKHGAKVPNPESRLFKELSILALHYIDDSDMKIKKKI